MPAFVNLIEGDYHLLPNTECVDTGNNSYAPTSVDLDGKNRIAGVNVDMGVYELQVFYVNINSSNPTPPYTNWATAARNIQDAANIADVGDLVLVTNGIYSSGGRLVHGAVTNRVALIKPITVQSVNGSPNTTIVGDNNGLVRCAYLTNGAILTGFTLTNGILANDGNAIQENSGGGAWGESTNAIISNCFFVENFANYSGGGAYSCTLSNCQLINNSAVSAGGEPMDLWFLLPG
ncbi:MAG: choice-of-anchor Q domain-containing protein [Verrucomicrobiota bacterium]